MDTGAIEKYERGELSWQDTVQLFQELIDEGHACRLQGCYGRFEWTLLEEDLHNYLGQRNFAILKQYSDKSPHFLFQYSN